MYNNAWWVSINRTSLDSFVCECWKCNIVCFGVEQIPKKIRKYIRNKSIITNIHIIQVYDSVMCGYVCIGYTECKSLLDYTNLFYLNRCKKNDKILLNYFQ